ncbi:hypothetical protein M758_6G112600 [Ceratodon purpureus]|nr:hypothetical protein M758_6G112600 [Ceratodon purpureus]
MMIKVPLAIGIGVITLLVFCCLWWAAWKLRHCMRAKQIFATLEEILVENRKGLKKDVVRSFPIVKTSDLNVHSSSKLKCPICWLAFRDEDIMRQLPHCDHVFHRHCIDPVLEQQIICPVCGIVLTDRPKPAEELNGNTRGSPPQRHCQIPRRGLYSAKSAPTSPKSVSTPSWVLVNRPVPLPRNTLENSSSSSDRFEIELGNPYSDSVGLSGESPLLKYLSGSHEVGGWNDVDIDDEQKCIDISFTFGTDIPVEQRQTNHSSTYEKDVDSFSFSTGAGSNGTSLQEMAVDAAAAPPVSHFRSQLRRSRGRESVTSFSSDSTGPSSTRFSRSTSRSSRITSSSSDSSFQKLAGWEYAHPHLDDVAEHLPLTKPPEQCSFDVLPVITGSGSYALKDSTRVGDNRNTYSQL